MKTISKFSVAAMAVLGLCACNKETVAPDNNEDFVNVTFLAGIPNVATKATLTRMNRMLSSRQPGKQEMNSVSSI